MAEQFKLSTICYNDRKDLISKLSGLEKIKQGIKKEFADTLNAHTDTFNSDTLKSVMKKYDQLKSASEGEAQELRILFDGLQSVDAMPTTQCEQTVKMLHEEHEALAKKWKVLGDELLKALPQPK